MNTTLRIAAACVAVLLLTTTAQARHRHHHHSYITYGEESIVSHPAGCPWRAFCGCGVSVRIFGKPVRELFLASNWFRFPRANPAPGMVAVRSHHVMYIMAMDANGNATVYDPNSGGHQTRIHTRSLSGYVTVNPHGTKVSQN